MDTGVLRKSTEGNKPRNRRPMNNWFDEECKQQKRATNDAQKRWKADVTNPILKQNFFDERRKFKKITRRNKREEADSLNTTLTALSKTKSKEFWRRINLKGRKKKASQTQYIPTSEWFKHFKSLHEAHEAVIDNDP